jgi:tetratricopeptide (TPR) repeat protein
LYIRPRRTNTLPIIAAAAALTALSLFVLFRVTTQSAGEPSATEPEGDHRRVVHTSSSADISRDAGSKEVVAPANEKAPIALAIGQDATSDTPAPKPGDPAPSPEQPPATTPVTPPQRRPRPSPTTAEPTTSELYSSARRALRRGDHEDAIALVDRALAREQSGSGLLLKADILQSMGDPDRAIATLNTASRVSSRSSRVWKKKGLLHWELEQYGDAKQALERYLELQPDASDAADVRALIDSM